MKVGVIDILGKEPPRTGYSRFMRANNASIMAQVVAAWCEEEGHEVSIAYYSGPFLLAGGLSDDLDIVFVNAFSQAALVGYALSEFHRRAGAVTVLGGPHARSWPEDALKHFDYVVGFCDKPLLARILEEPRPSRPRGEFLSADGQPSSLPGLRQRWKYLEPAMIQARILRAVPLIGSLGCPYTCSFCIDATVPYQPMEFDILRDDLLFFQELRLPRKLAVWHDPNFGVRFDEYLDAIEEVVPPGRITFVCETSLSLLKESNAKRLGRNGFKAIAPGIESWFDIGGKSRMRRLKGMEKVERVADQVNMLQSYVPYTQANLIFGLDADEGGEPFELTRAFVDRAPAIYPHLSLLSAFGRNAALNLDYQRDGRVLNVPFHFLDLIKAMNVKPKNYDWIEFYDHAIDTFDHTFSGRAIARRLTANRHVGAGLEQTFRALSAERNNRLANLKQMRTWMEDPDFRSFFEGETREVPEQLVSTIRNHLGPLWELLPDDVLDYDPNAWLNSSVVPEPEIVSA